MRNNYGQPTTPSGLFTNRLRLCSINSPFISPLRIIPSPYIDDNNFLDPLQVNADLNHFQLEYNDPQENGNEIPPKAEEEAEQESEIEPPLPFDDNQDISALDETNILDFVLRNLNKNQKRLEEGRNKLESYGSEFNKKLFEYLVVKFKKLRKTKEEMVKYCVRKSFKYITNKMRAANKELFANMENNEVVAEYFERNCEGDLSITMPFKKNSEEKTMNGNFLKKIFKCRQFNVDYRSFLKQFPAEYYSDNQKKIKSMNDSIKKCVKSKCFKSLDEYKRLPWTVEILEKIFDFAKNLMENSPYKKEQIDQKAMEKSNDFSQTNHENLQTLNNELKVPSKKSVIILTPPVRALESPSDISEERLLE